MGEHVAGGFVLVEATDRREWMDPELVPGVLWSPSDCLCTVLPDCGATEKDWPACAPADVETLARLGVDRAAYRSWVGDAVAAGRLGWWNILQDVDCARRFAARFLTAADRPKLLGIALPPGEPFEHEAEQRPPRSGVEIALDRRAALPAGGVPLGYEVLGSEAGSFHSFLCNSLERLYAERLGIRLNEHAKIPSLADARRAAELTRSDEVGAEPVDWRPWLIVEYPLQVDGAAAR